MKIKDVEVTERGWAGHLIFASGCRFRRNTLLEYKDKKWIVSTEGAYVGMGNKFTEIGLGRYYETMAFVATKQGVYYDADVTQEIDFDSKWAVGTISEESDQEANDMHEAVVAELIEKIKK